MQFNSFSSEKGSFLLVTHFPGNCFEQKLQKINTSDNIENYLEHSGKITVRAGLVPRF